MLLGSASLDLIQHSIEALAGRLAFVELSGLHRLAISPDLGESLWVRGGFQPSLTAQNDANSVQWRRDFTRTYLERDVAPFTPQRLRGRAAQPEMADLPGSESYSLGDAIEVMPLHTAMQRLAAGQRG